MGSLVAVPTPTLDHPFDALTLLAAALCAFRLTRLVVADRILGRHPETDESGKIVHPATGLRLLLDRWAYDESGNDRTSLRGWLADLLTCSYCAGVYVSALVVVWLAGGPQWRAWPVWLGAVAGAQALMSRFTD